MGYRSNVAIEIQGTKENIRLVLNTYRMAVEGRKDFHEVYNVLGGTLNEWVTDEVKEGDELTAYVQHPMNGPEDFLVIRTDTDRVATIWKWNEVKWYAREDEYLELLFDVINSLKEQVEVSAYFIRTGENPDDIEEREVGGGAGKGLSNIYPYADISIPDRAYSVALHSFFKDEEKNHV